MAPTLGKRKRVSRAELEQASRSPSPSSESNDSGAEDLQAIFRRAFEAKFKPLPAENKKPKIEQLQVEDEDEEEEEDEESDWSGISESSTPQVEIIEYKPPLPSLSETEKAEKKAFMSSKPPTSTPTPAKPLTLKKKPDDTSSTSDPTDATNLKNDLALQKLLRDSHILSASSSGTSTPTPTSTPGLQATGLSRHKSTDLHLLTLGAKSSIYTQKNKPMAQRKHEVAKARAMEEKRRARAREAGIVLEVERKGKGKVGGGIGEGAKKRERGVGGPSVGRFRGGTLSLSREDVRSITGGGGGGGGGKGGKGRKGKR